MSFDYIDKIHSAAISSLKLYCARHPLAAGALLLRGKNCSYLRTQAQNLLPISPIRTLSLLEDLKYLALDNMAEIKILDPDPLKHADDASLSSTVDNSISSEEDDSFHEGSSTGSSSPKLLRQPFSQTDLKDLANNQKLLAIAKGSDPNWNSPSPFTKFRWQYLLAYIGIMLADGLQGI